jgi:hypothetical protein
MGDIPPKWKMATAAQAQDRPFQFALFGDMPYTKVHEQKYPRVLRN